MSWYLVTTKVKSEQQALSNLNAQGFHCLLPMAQVEVCRRGVRKIENDPLFPRYLFIELEEGVDAFHKVKNTRGVAGFVGFGTLATPVCDKVISWIQARFCEARQVVLSNQPKQGEEVEILHGPFKALNAVFECSDGEKRSMVLLSILQQQVRLSIENQYIQKTG